MKCILLHDFQHGTSYSTLYVSIGALNVNVEDFHLLNRISYLFYLWFLVFVNNTSQIQICSFEKLIILDSSFLNVS